MFGVLSYWYVRIENERANDWIDSRLDEMRTLGGRDGDRLTASVMHIDTSPGALSSSAMADSGVRLIAPTDIDRCVELINATHRSLDLFRPYTNDFLESRLDDLFWGPKPPFVPHVYDWTNMFVLEEAGEILACAGLWDRGNDVREVWFNRVTGEERIEDTACAMDTGHAPGRPDALARLLEHLAHATSELGRSSLSVALEFLPEVAAECRWAQMSVETRKMESMMFSSPEIQVAATITRPYTDLAYW